MATTTKTYYPKSDPQMRGVRLKTIRAMTGLTRQEFEKKYAISASTVQSWEAAKAGGLTERGAMRLLPLFRQEGISCSMDWLLHGIGDPPQLLNEFSSNYVMETPAEYFVLSESKVIIRELLIFRKMNENPIDFQIKDDGMGPHYAIGDYVAGKRRYKQDIASVIGMNCIVQTSSNEVLFRRVQQASKSGLFNLICTNLNTTVALHTMYDQDLISAAPVIWHRRLDEADLI